MEKIEKKEFGHPDETMAPSKAKVQVVRMNGYEVRKVTFAPGWKWSNDFKPAQKTEWCEQMHIMYHLSGRMHIKSSDGTEMDVGPGDLMVIPPKHDGWVVGKEPAVVLDFAGVASKK